MKLQFKFTNTNQWANLISWLRDNLKRGIDGGAVVITLGRETRTAEQNRLLWPLLTDVSNQAEWAARKLRPEHWKMLFMSAYRQEAGSIIMGLNGEPINLDLSTSKLNKAEFSELIEFIYATGCSRGVVFTEPALKIYEEYGIK